MEGGQDSLASLNIYWWIGYESPTRSVLSSPQRGMEQEVVLHVCNLGDRVTGGLAPTSK